MKVLLLTTALAALAPLAASAVTFNVTGAGLDSEGTTLYPSGTATYNFEVNSATPLTFSFIIAGTGYATDLADVTFGIDGSGTTTTWSSIIPPTGIASASGTLASITTSSNFSITFYDGVTDPVGISLTYIAEVAPVPVPSSLPLLIGGMGAFGLVLRKRAKKA
ncbi:PEP-CTERM sorting domain-containing protein [Tropicimonas sp. IMCC34043]|uniref:PEP-CTERM sorting domain-containing protein n=1 Tax=Tropicimonas sp. IMCC34043 TaxID=2248760 RepID=UPI000E280980|nr:PEP-CTERM sorting domain-containing protein [Tropicimonas sp. IMCC34043]